MALVVRLIIALSFVLAAPQATPIGRRPTTRYDDFFRKYSKRYFGPGFAWRIFKAQAIAESGLDSAAVSDVGARGIMQLMPATFGDFQAQRADAKGVEDPQTNIAAGIAHDAYLWKLFGSIEPNSHHYRFMMAAYNAGEGTIQRAQKVAAVANADPNTWSGVASVAPKVPRWRYRETLGYVRKIGENYGTLSSSAPHLGVGAPPAPRP